MTTRSRVSSGGPCTGSGVAIVVAFLVAGCSVGPDYVRPTAPAPAAFKEAPAAPAGWYPAAPADTLDRGPWWELFGDPALNGLVAQVEVSNQNVARAVAAYAEARASVDQYRATLFPSLGLDASAQRNGSHAGGAGNAVSLGLGASWSADLWGALRRSVESARASAAASAADLAAARLSAQGEVATDYVYLRATDAQIALTASSIEGYERSLKITQDRYAAAIAAKTDVLQAQTLLDTTRANLATLRITRAQYEHAIAVLIGKAPAGFSLAPGEWIRSVPAVPRVLPSELLQRRPDIAAAERRTAAANAAIGIQRAGYFPSLGLSASLGNSGTRIPDLFSVATRVWSLGLSATQTLFDAGATRARVAGAEAAYDAEVGGYRQTVLSAFQGVEDQLVAMRYLAEQEAFRRSASEAADLTEQQLLNRYKQGQIAYTDVVNAQVSALNARSTLSQLIANRQSAVILLIQNLGGGWHAEEGER